jgi:hypothetical protein
MRNRPESASSAAAHIRGAVAGRKQGMKTILPKAFVAGALALAGLVGGSLHAAAAEPAVEKEFKAKIEAMPEKGWLGEWKIGGYRVAVTEATKLEEDDGQKFEIGQSVEVEGNLRDGVVYAREIETER